ncbi:membrane-bound PQQ-dependent dehydrogenase, glucose/quinate/shikimate family [Tardiphaga sp.]|uniref:membrane-bound PQQ-dependent dehydrogenase, glucose/quinate/shikimate family n=1 Tax=Tardiphaga sp. TaxID=1926292 RepID=UPI0037DA0E59
MKDVNVGWGSKALLALLGLLFVASGIAFIWGGGVLISRGGSYYYLIAGLALAGVGIGVALGKTFTLPLYAVLFVATAVWAVWESGFEFWPLFARLFIFLAAAFVLALVNPLLRARAGLPRATGKSMAVAAVFLVAMVAALGGMFVDRTETFAAVDTGKVKVTPETEQKNWDNWGNNPGGERFAALDQINRSNVNKLKVAWTFQTGDIADNDESGLGSEDQQTPMQVGSTVYLCTPHNNVIALDADTGKEKWRQVINARHTRWMRCRGLAYIDLSGQQANRGQSANLTQATDASGTACTRRLYTNSVTGQLIALDADTGKFCEGFGDNGRVDLLAGLGKTPPGVYKVTSAPTLAGDVIVLGGFVADNLAVDVPSGVIRAYDVVTGKQRWAWDAGNPAIKGPSTTELAYTRGSPNSWAPMSYDPKLNLVFIPMGNASPDLWGGNRTPEAEKYASSVVALDGSTGDVRWTFQTVHHDLWDFDVPMQPTATDFPNADGSKTPAIVVGTKHGQIFVLDRATGKPLTKVEEVPIPAGNLKGERYSPTQPLSTGMPEIGRSTLTEADMWGVTPFDQLLCRIEFKGYRHIGLFDPPTADQWQLQYPGSLGGLNWGSISVDPVSNLLFLNDMRLGLWQKAFERKEGEKILPGAVPMTGAPYWIFKDRFLSALRVPCQKPPFGTMTAVDLKTQKIVWQKPMGTVQDTGPVRLKMGLPIPIGMPTIGGSMATQGGLVFFAATLDYYLRAIDSATGKELWKGRLPVGSQATPITYKSPATGKQYVLITAGGARQSLDRGDHVVAYTLGD